MKKCPKCAEQVQHNAKVCRFCGHKFDSGKDFLIGCAIPCVVAVALISQCGPDKSKAPITPCEDRVMAFVMAQDFIKDRLKAPSTADFPTLSSGRAKATPIKLPDGRCAFLVSTPVDAQNGFGAMIRERYTVTVAPDLKTKDRWLLLNFDSP